MSQNMFAGMTAAQITERAMQLAAELDAIKASRAAGITVAVDETGKVQVKGVRGNMGVGLWAYELETLFEQAPNIAKQIKAWREAGLVASGPKDPAEKFVIARAAKQAAYDARK